MATEDLVYLAAIAVVIVVVLAWMLGLTGCVYSPGCSMHGTAAQAQECFH